MLRCIGALLKFETDVWQNLLPSNDRNKHRKPRRLLSLTPLFSTDYKAGLRSKNVTNKPPITTQ